MSYKIWYYGVSGAIISIVLLYLGVSFDSEPAKFMTLAIILNALVGFAPRN